MYKYFKTTTAQYHMYLFISRNLPIGRKSWIKIRHNLLLFFIDAERIFTLLICKVHPHSDNICYLCLQY